MELEFGQTLPAVRIAFETWGTLNADASNAVLVLHALTGDSHVLGSAGPGHHTAGWWPGIVGPGGHIDTDRWFVVSPNMLGGCQGTTGPASSAPDGAEWGARFPFISIRDQANAHRALSDALGISRWAAVVGGSMGGMQVLEFAISHPKRVDKIAVLAAPATATADQIASNSVQLEAIHMDSKFAGGDYYEAKDGDGPHRGLALARRMALLNYRSPDELNGRFTRSWQSGISPLGEQGRYAVESYLDFHGNKFARRFDANSYVTLVHAMSSHDIARGRESADAALGSVEALSLVLGIDSDRLFPLEEQRYLARQLPNPVGDQSAIEIQSEYGHDGFLIENDSVGAAITSLLNA